MDTNAKINLNNLGIKAQSKSELYKLLKIEARLYLPPCRETSVKFIREIFSGEKKILYHDEIKVVSVPHVKGLRVNDLYCFLRDQCEDGLSYLPSDYFRKILNRDYLCNLCNSLNENDFRLLIDDALSEREQKFIQKHNIEISCDPKLAEVLEKSKMISCNKGRSHLLLKPKRQAKQKTVEDQIIEKEVEQKYRDQLIDLQTQVCLLESELKEKEDECKDNRRYSKILEKLYDGGHIDKEGNIVSDQ